MSVDTFGDNAKGYIKGVVERVLDVQEQIDGLKSDRKELVKDLKKADLPVAELVALRKQDADNVAAKAKRLREAGAILETDVFCGLVPASENTDNHGFSDDDIKDARSVSQRIVNLDEEIKELKSEVKEIYKEAKSQGFSVPTLKICVAFALNPKAKDSFNESSSLIDVYLEAANG